MNQTVIKNLEPIEKLAELYTIGSGSDTDLTEGIDFLIIEGGRGGGKSEGVTEAYVNISRKESTKILCTREIQKTIDDSVKAMIEECINRLGLISEFKITNTSIINIYTGTNFIFMGMRAATQSTDSLKSLKGVKYVWYEEAQTATEPSLEILTPTIRIDGRKIIFTMNRKTTNDAVQKYFEYKKKVRIIKINYLENQYCPQVTIDEAEEMKELDYEKYRHIWLGEPLPEDTTRIVLPRSWLIQCIDLHKQVGYEIGRKTGGFDVADGILDKHDKNSLATRSGPVVLSCENWRIEEVYQSVERINGRYNELGFETLYFDSTSLGVAAKSEFSRLNSSMNESDKLPYFVIPFMGSASPGGKDKVFVSHGKQKVTNGMYFQNKTVQCWWNLRLRLENSIKLIKGMTIDRPDYFLSFSSDISNLEDIFDELSQATFEENHSGKITIDKAPGLKEVIVDGKTKKRKSPNDADSIRYSFAGDLTRGLRAHAAHIKKAEVI